MIVALVGGLMLVNQSQDSRKGAAFANTALVLLPSDKITKAVGENLLVHMNYATEGGAKLYNVDTVVCYGSNLELSATESTGNADLGYSAPMILDAAAVGSNKCSKVVVLKETSKINVAEASGELAVLKFKAVSAGSGTITIDKEKSKATGENTASETDKWITVTQVTGTSYEIIGSKVETTGDEIKLKMTYAGVIEGTKCAVDWPIKVIVMAGSEKKEISGIKTVRTSEKVNNMMVYEASFRLGDFSGKENLALFVKGPKHLQMKYAKANQEGPYGKAGGEISVNQSYDFSKYSALAGDVDLNGWINGQDFSKVKAKAVKYEAVADGGDILEDLDGSCQVNTRDVTLLVNSLDQKQEELY